MALIEINGLRFTYVYLINSMVILSTAMLNK